jgi:dolichol-phosphate mannosyltransferase
MHKENNKQMVSVVVPVYNNEGSLPLLFDELIKVEGILLKQDINLEIIFVDDGSADASLKELLEIKKKRERTKIIKLTRNFGAVHASKTGLQFVSGDCFVFLAADLQDPPDLILQMVEKWKTGAKYIICERNGRDDSFLSQIFSKFYYKLVRLLVISDFPENGFDLALMDRVLLPYMLQSSKSAYTPIMSYWLGFKPEIISYKRRKREHGKSQWTFFKKIVAFFDAILSFSVVPIRMMSLFGLIVAIMSFVYGSWIVINTLLGNAEIRGFATVVVLISFFMGLVIIMLGMIGEYIWRIYDEVNKRPETVIDEIY